MTPHNAPAPNYTHLKFNILHSYRANLWTWAIDRANKFDLANISLGDKMWSHINDWSARDPPRIFSGKSYQGAWNLLDIRYPYKHHFGSINLKDISLIIIRKSHLLRLSCLDTQFECKIHPQSLSQTDIRQTQCTLRLRAPSPQDTHYKCHPP